jgi:4-hydroxybenzoyl-CoA reductase subunit beta
MNNAKYETPLTIADAVQLAKENTGNFKYIAGGTDVFVNRFQGNENSACLIDITKIDELRTIRVRDDELCIGALVRLNELGRNEIIQKEFPAITQAANSVGSPLIRSSATIGGNILCENRCYYFNQSQWWRDTIGLCLKCNGEICIVTGTGKKCYAEFVSDVAPVLISMNASVEIAGDNASRTERLEDIYTGDGINPNKLNPTDILKYIRLPRGKNKFTVFKKLRKRESIDFTSLTTAVSLHDDGSLKIAISGVDPKPVVIESEKFDDVEKIIKLALKMSRSIDNEMQTRNYRRQMIEVFLKKSFIELQQM